MVQILRRPKAIEDIEEIADYIATDSLRAAIRFLENTESTLQALAEFPSSGGLFHSDHPRLANVRFRRIKGFPKHVVFYIEKKDAIEVIRVLHGARNLDGELKKP
ncbi:MAG: type II toxin-antitoxin system RelE/ParE family toxin [Pirellulales bacterium]